jgi:amino-acid N-acetyltransferase
MRTRLARQEDAPAICRLIQFYADQDLLLPRTPEQVRADIRNFLVLTDSAQNGKRERILGCVALEPYGPHLVEVRSLAVAPDLQGNGLGGRLVEAALSIARRRKIARVFAVTHAPAFFERHGFVPTTRQALPEKIARYCNTCPKESRCKLVTLVAVVCPEHTGLLNVLATDGVTVGV